MGKLVLYKSRTQLDTILGMFEEILNEATRLEAARIKLTLLLSE